MHRFYPIPQALASFNFDISLAEMKVFANGMVHGTPHGWKSVR